MLLVETPTSEEEGTTGFPQIVTGEKYVIDRHLGGVISQSFSATEQTFPSRAALLRLRLRGAYTDAGRNGVTVLAASGDSGAADARFSETSFYLHPAGLVDITRGNNTVAFEQGGKRHTVRGFRARTGYDLGSGAGTVTVRLFGYELANAAGHP
jgi:hypothetical protein